MNVTMLSHASVLIEAGPIALCTDPWFLGTVFNESWSLISPPAITPAGLGNTSHVWISHEHPDHLNFPTLKAIPDEHKATITLLYQEHFSSRMCRALSNLGFQRVVELPLSRWHTLDDDTSVLCCSVGAIDSLLAVRSKGVTVLNLNDCAIRPAAAEALAKLVGPVDVLLTQFSIASWVANPGDVNVAAPHNVIKRMRTYIHAFQPKTVIPFASFAYFSHSENRHMNRWVNTPTSVCEQLKDVPCKVQFLYNGDSWSSQKGFSLSGNPVIRYENDFEVITKQLYTSHPSYPLDELLDLGKKLVRNIRASFPTFVLKTTTPLYFYVVDLGIAVLVDLYRNVVEGTHRSKSACDIALGSQALWYAFKFPWGLTTLDVSGRYELMNPNMSNRTLSLCHLYCSDISFKGFPKRLAQRRSWKFLWAKRYELLDRLISKRQDVLQKPQE